MAVWHETRISTIEDEFRFDAEYYRSEYKKYAQELSQIDSVPLGQVAYITDGQHGYFKLDPNSNIRQITAKHIIDGLVNKKDADRLSYETHSKNLRSSLTPGDVLVTSAGTIGSIGYVTEEVPPANIDQDLFRVHTRNNNIDPLFLWIFLQTRFGQFQIKRFITGQVQFHLSLTKARKIKLPIRDWQDEVVTSCREYVNLRKSSESLYARASQLLEQELGLDKIKFEKPIGYEASFNNVVFSRRGDAEFYNPELRYYYKSLVKNFDLVSITKFVNIFKFGNPTYANAGIAIITQKHLQNLSPAKYEGDLFADLNWVKLYPQAILRYNDLVYYSVGAYLGKTNIWLNKEEQAVPASFITLLRAFNDYDAGYLFVLLNSKYGFLQSKVFQSGTSLQYIYPKDISQFLVPDINVKLRGK
jgi:hypothetical protein